MKKAVYISLCISVVISSFAAGCREIEEKKESVSLYSSSEVTVSSSQHSFSSIQSSLETIASSSQYSFSSIFMDSSSDFHSSFSNVEEENSVNIQLLEIDDKNITVFYGDEITLGTHMLKGKWFFTNREMIPSNWVNVYFEDDGSCSINVFDELEISLCKYGMNEDMSILYITGLDEINISYTESMPTSCFNVNEFIFPSRKVNYLCNEIDDKNSSLIFANNTEDTGIKFIQYSGNEIILYKNEETKFGKHLLYGTWFLNTSPAYLFTFSATQNVEVAQLATSANPNFITLYGVNKNGTRLYYQGAPDTSVVDFGLGGYENYYMLEIKEVKENGCYLVDARDLYSMLKLNEKEYLVEMCKEQ